MNLSGEREPTKRGWLAKWAENALAAARKPTTEFRRGQHAFAIATLTLRILFVFVLGTIGVAIILAGLGAFETIPGVTLGVVRPRALVWALVNAFLIYLVILHLYAIFRLARYRKAALQAMEYAYFLLGAFGLAAVAGVGVERAGWARQFYADRVASVRSNFDFYAENVARPLCGQLGPRLPSIPTAAVCQWIEEAKLLAHRPLDGNSARDREDVRKLLEDAKNLDATIPSAARAKAMVEGGETITEEPHRDLTENQRAGFRWFRSLVEATAERDFHDLLEQGGQIAKIDTEIKETQESLLMPKWIGFFLLAFAIALRITKLSVEAFRIGPQ